MVVHGSTWECMVTRGGLRGVWLRLGTRIQTHARMRVWLRETRRSQTPLNPPLVTMHYHVLPCTTTYYHALPCITMYCSTGSTSMTSQLENEPRTLLFIFVHTLTYIKLCMDSNKGMSQNRHGVYRKNNRCLES